MKSDVSLRRIDPREVPVVGELIRDTMRASYPVVYPPRAVEFFLHYQSDDSIARRTESGIVIVAERDGEIVATGSLIGSEITGVFVRVDLQRKKLGSLVMDRLEACAAESGQDHVELSVSLPSRRFYEERGYRITGPARIDVGQGQVLEYWEGDKPLGGIMGSAPEGRAVNPYSRK